MKPLKGDLHADTIQYSFDNNLNLNNKGLSFNTFDVKDYLPYIQFLSCFVHDKFRNNGYDRVNKILEYYYKKQGNTKLIHTIRSKDDINKVIFNNKLGAILTVENGIALDGKEDSLYKLFEKGIRLMTITWNGQNEIGCGNEVICDSGLTAFGQRCINIMNDMEMIVDISHSSYKTFWGVANITNRPIIASHSNIYNICNNKRNLKDNQIKEIAKLGGLIGITYYDRFLVNKGKASIIDVIKHIEYACNLVGIDHVCLGSDFDGVNKINLPYNLKSVKDICKLEECMLTRGFNTCEIQKIMGGNIERFLRENLI